MKSARICAILAEYLARQDLTFPLLRLGLMEDKKDEGLEDWGGVWLGPNSNVQIFHCRGSR